MAVQITEKEKRYFTVAQKQTTKGKANLKSPKEQRKKLGRRSKTKGSNFERDVARKFKDHYNEELTRTPQSGGFAKKSTKADEFRGDIVSLDEKVDLLLHIECKNAKTWSLPTWFNQAESDSPKGKVPCVIFHKHGTSKDYIALSLEDFFRIVPKDSIIKRKGE